MGALLSAGQHFIRQEDLKQQVVQVQRQVKLAHDGVGCLDAAQERRGENLGGLGKRLVFPTPAVDGVSHVEGHLHAEVGHS